jgi:hypothetical protein
MDEEEKEEEEEEEEDQNTWKVHQKLFLIRKDSRGPILSPPK